jgi:hypothetical protein
MSDSQTGLERWWVRVINEPRTAIILDIFRLTFRRYSWWTRSFWLKKCQQDLDIWSHLLCFFLDAVNWDALGQLLLFFPDHRCKSKIHHQLWYWEKRFGTRTETETHSQCDVTFGYHAVMMKQILLTDYTCPNHHLGWTGISSTICKLC